MLLIYRVRPILRLHGADSNTNLYKVFRSEVESFGIKRMVRGKGGVEPYA